LCVLDEVGAVLEESRVVTTPGFSGSVSETQ
jgi:hypothetical protein